MPESAPAVACILGSAFDAGLEGLTLEPLTVRTSHGEQALYRVAEVERPAYVLFRHGRPHRLLPNQIDYRAQAAALGELGVGALLTTSSVGVMTPELPLYEPLLVSDVLMPDNRLPDGSACTLFTQPEAEQGHLVLDEGLCSRRLGDQIEALAEAAGSTVAGSAVFAYVGGPRTKSAAENRFWVAAGAQINAMTLAPELVLANELGIPAAAVVVGHKYSLPDGDNPPDGRSVARSLVDSRTALERIAVAFLRYGAPVAFANHLFRFGADAARRDPS